MIDKTNFVEVSETWLGWARKQSVFTSGEAAAARSTRLRPIHFSNRGNGRGFQLLTTAIITKL